MAELQASYARAEAAEEDSCWAMVADPHLHSSPPTSIRIAHANEGGDEDQDEDTSHGWAHSLCRLPAVGLDADREELDACQEEEEEWEAEWHAMEDTLLHRQKGRRQVDHRQTRQTRQTPRPSSRRPPLVSSLRREVLARLETNCHPRHPDVSGRVQADKATSVFGFGCIGPGSVGDSVGEDRARERVGDGRERERSAEEEAGEAQLGEGGTERA